jgi:anti-sigma28 factor (negative regulator of flagellin synthesis)
LIERKLGNDKERLELVRSHISGGFYNRRDIVEATASAVIRSQALHILLDRYELDHPQVGKFMTENPKITEIRRKIDDGYYDDPNHLAELVEKLIKKFGLE